MSDKRPARGLLDTSVVLELEWINARELPVELAVSPVTIAELGAGPHATTEPAERARRQE